MAYVTDDQGNPVSDGQGGLVSDGQPSIIVFDARATVFFVAEVEAFRWVPDGVGVTDTLRISDQGYRSRASDPIGVQAYPGLLDTAFELDRRLPLDPAQAATLNNSAVRINNTGSRLDSFVTARNVDSRRIRILIGQKTFDAARGIYLDPPYTSLQPFYAGACSSWLLAEDTIELPLKDTSYWTQRPIQSKTYAGTGGLAGDAALAGKAIPMARGGTQAQPILNVPLVTVDTVNRIYQFTDGPGTVVNLYEGGKAVFTYAGDVADLTAGATPSGAYRTCSALGVLQLGSNAQGQITADVTGTFAVAGAVTTAVALAQAVLVETLGLPAEYCDNAAFDTVNQQVAYAAGFWNDGTSTGLQVVQTLLLSAGARLGSTRSGMLRPYLLRQPPGPDAGAVALTPANTISVTPAALPDTLDPPPYRWRVGYNRNYTVMTSGLNSDIATGKDADSDARRQFLAAPMQYATVTEADVSAAWLRPNDPAPLETYLLDGTAARFVGEDHNAFWRYRPDSLTVVVPMDIAARLDIGSAVPLAWPLGALAAGATVVVVGEQIRSYDATASLEVLVVNAAAGFSGDFSSDFLGGST